MQMVNYSSTRKTGEKIIRILRHGSFVGCPEVAPKGYGAFWKLFDRKFWNRERTSVSKC